MRKTGLFTFLILILFGCQTNEYQNIVRLTYKESSLLRFHITNCRDTMNFTFYYNTYFPYGQTLEDITFYKDTTYSFKIHINHPVTVHFFDSKRTQTISFFALPKDSLDIYFNADTSQKFSESIKYKGSTSSISNYLTKGQLNIGPSPAMDDDIYFYNGLIDSLTQKRQKALSDYNRKEQLPDWYFKFERINIDYLGARDKVYQFRQRQEFYSQQLQKPSDFYDKLGVKIDNPDAKFCEGYLPVVFSILPEKYDTLLTPNKINSEIFFHSVGENINTTNKFLGEDIKSFIIASRISAMLNIKSLIKLKENSFRFERIDSLMASVKPQFKDTTLYSYLLSYKKEQIQSLEKYNNLGKGDKSPDFILKDINDKTVKLSDFKGQYVVINFWTLWCSGCIKSIAKKNQLVQDYNKNGLVLLNVCLDFDKVKWKKIITDNHFQGVHVICKGEWKNILSKNYDINIVPHYTIIDKKGNIISNTIENFTALEDLLKEDLK